MKSNRLMKKETNSDSSAEGGQEEAGGEGGEGALGQLGQEGQEAGEEGRERRGRRRQEGARSGGEENGGGRGRGEARRQDGEDANGSAEEKRKEGEAKVEALEDDDDVEIVPPDSVLAVPFSLHSCSRDGGELFFFPFYNYISYCSL